VADPEQLPATGAVVGVDLGIKDFTVTSGGEKIANPRKLACRNGTWPAASGGLPASTQPDKFAYCFE